MLLPNAEAWHPDWLVPEWPAPLGVHAVFTTRAGGGSAAAFNGFNLGLHVGDDADQVLHNRALLSRAIGHAPVFMNQVHGTGVLNLDLNSARAPAHAQAPAEADAACTRSAGQVCTVMVADCLPILLCSTDGAWVAAAHAGWRGLAGDRGLGIVESVLSAFYAFAPVNRAQHAPEIIAWLGPCIGPQAFEVGPEVRAAFADTAASTVHRATVVACFTAQGGGKFLANLQALARLRLAAGGVGQVYGNDGTPQWCTASNASRFFSYRRDRICGRMAACIWRD